MTEKAIIAEARVACSSPIKTVGRTSSDPGTRRRALVESLAAIPRHCRQRNKVSITLQHRSVASFRFDLSSPSREFSPSLSAEPTNPRPSVFLSLHSASLAALRLYGRCLRSEPRRRRKKHKEGRPKEGAVPRKKGRREKNKKAATTRTEGQTREINAQLDVFQAIYCETARGTSPTRTSASIISAE